MDTHHAHLVEGTTFPHFASKLKANRPHQDTLGAKGGQAPQPNGNFDFLNGSIKGGTFPAQASNLKSKALMREVLEPMGVRPQSQMEILIF